MAKLSEYYDLDQLFQWAEESATALASISDSLKEIATQMKHDNQKLTGWYGTRLKELGYIEVHDNGERKIIYSPRVEDLERICEDHRFDYERTAKMISELRPDCNGLLIVAETYRDYLANGE